jgi:hypothetical protein
MLESAVAVGVPLGRLSFKGSSRALALWSANLRSPRAGPRHRAQLWDTLLAVVAMVAPPKVGHGGVRVERLKQPRDDHEEETQC